MSTSDPDGKADDRHYVEFAPGVIALLLEGKQVEEALLFAYAQREWVQLVRHLRRAKDPRVLLSRLVELGKVTEEQLADVEDAARAIGRGAELPLPGLRRPFVRVSTLLADPRLVPPDVVAGFLPGEAVALISGTEGIAKSYAMLHLALCVAAGIPWLGLAVNQRPVLIVDLENRPRRLRERIRKMSHLVDNDEQRLSELPLTIHGMPTSYKLDDPRFVEELVYLAKQTDAGLIILDSLVDFEGDLDENSNSDMGRAALRLRQITEETGASVLLIHHVPKHLAGKAGQTPRGASSLAAGVDVVANAIGDNDKLVITQTKNRDAKPMSLRLQMTFTNTSFTLQRLGAEGPPDDKVAAAIRDYIQDGSWHRSSEVVHALVEKGIASSGTIHDRLRTMAENGAIETDPPPEQRKSRQSYRLRLRRGGRWQTGG